MIGNILRQLSKGLTSVVEGSAIAVDGLEASALGIAKEIPKTVQEYTRDATGVAQSTLKLGTDTVTETSKLATDSVKAITDSALNLTKTGIKVGTDVVSGAFNVVSSVAKDTMGAVKSIVPEQGSNNDGKTIVIAKSDLQELVNVAQAKQQPQQS